LQDLRENDAHDAAVVVMDARTGEILAMVGSADYADATIDGAVNIATDITVRSRRVMGVNLPVVETQFTEHSPYYSPMGTSFWIDGSINEFKQALQLMGRLAELKISIIRLATEVRKTIRKVNALEKIAIPELRSNVLFIQNRLEENERDMFVLMKMVKNRLLVRKGEIDGRPHP
jgi:V/A-type H+-transporting ATPase subunit D